MELNDSIKTIKGIGDKTASAFARLGIETVNDLLLNYPRTYVTYEDPVDISDLQAGSRQSSYRPYKPHFLQTQTPDLYERNYAKKDN